jgi:hypothetical protein
MTDEDEYVDPRLEWGATLKPGDIVNDCRYLNIKIKEITPVESKEVGVFDYNIVTEDGQGCSLTGCCNFPMTDEEIKESLLMIEDGCIPDKEEAIRWVMEHPYHNHL